MSHGKTLHTARVPWVQIHLLIRQVWSSIHLDLVGLNLGNCFFFFKESYCADHVT